jgi:hypothetical protein
MNISWNLLIVIVENSQHTEVRYPGELDEEVFFCEARRQEEQSHVYGVLQVPPLRLQYCLVLLKKLHLRTT